jgi:hypothetical protein
MSSIRRPTLRSVLTPAVLAIALALPGAAAAHPERGTKFPDPHTGSVPNFRTTGPLLVVCKPDSLSRLKFGFRGDSAGLRTRVKQLRSCGFRNIQAAVNAAHSNARILIMPGIYREDPSRHVAVGGFGQPPCANNYVETEGFTNTAPPPAGPASNDPPVRPDRNYAVNCPNSKNLIEVVGDPRPEPTPLDPTLPLCLQKCNLQITGGGKGPGAVLIQGDRRKIDVFRIDRANGIYLGNFMIEQGWFNDVDIVEVDGFHVTGIVARYAQNYGILSFTAIHGLYDHIEAYNNGDSGVYPGSNQKGCNVDPNVNPTYCDAGSSADNPRASCGELTTELKQINSHDNVLGYSGTAGNSTWVHDSEFHDNVAGLTTDSFASGHPGMPQECFKWEHNRIHSNNTNYFTAERQDYCNKVPFESRPKEIVCPQFQAPVGIGILIAGGDRDLFQNNLVYDNWRWGAGVIGVPAAIRGDSDPSHQTDTSLGNQFLNNQMGMRPDGSAAPNGVDFYWDGEGSGNCWQGNTSKSGPGRQSNLGNLAPPGSLPGCPGSAVYSPNNPAVSSTLVPCTAWDPKNNPRPVACDWFDTPPKPS